jgi:hypothetical protein
VSDFVLDASLVLRWFLEDETDREYSLKIWIVQVKSAPL